MEWIRGVIDDSMARLAKGPLFQSLDGHIDSIRLGRPGATLDARRWVSSVVRQMRWQAREFTESLAARVICCSDSRFKNLFAEHAAEEVAHPSELEQWMEFQGIPIPSVPTMETVMLTSYTWRAAWRESAPVQVVVMNMVGEAVALQFYSRFIVLLDILGMIVGPGSRYWRTHKEIDSVHMGIGVDLCTDAVEGTPLGEDCRRAAAIGMTLYHEALTSWDRYAAFT